jgi:hypothetical protein
VLFIILDLIASPQKMKARTERSHHVNLREFAVLNSAHDHLAVNLITPLRKH